MTVHTKIGFAVISLSFLLEFYACGVTSSLANAYIEETTEGTFSNQLEELETNITSAELPCNYAPGLSLGNRERELECCRITERRYEFYWAGRSLPLNRYLATLKGWNCPHFNVECDERVFAFNDFTGLLYDYFCNYTTFVTQCVPEVTKTIQKMQARTDTSIVYNPSMSTYPKQGIRSFDAINNENQSIISTWQELLIQVQSTQMTIDELLQPCVQVAQYDQEAVHDGGFQEIIDFGIPSCKIAWCGLGADAMQTHQVSIWTCLTSQ